MHHDLADMTGMLHQVQSLPDIVGAKDAVRQRRQCPLPEQLHQLHVEPRTDILRVDHQLIEVDAEIGEILAERPKADMRVGRIVAFSKLDKATECAQAGDAAFHRFAGETVENDVDTRSGDRPHLLDETGGSRIEHIRHAQCPEQVAFGLRARRRDDACAACLRNLDRGHADGSRSSVNEHPLAAIELRLPGERIISRQECHRDGRAGLKAQCIGQLCSERRGYRDMR